MPRSHAGRDAVELLVERGQQRVVAVLRIVGQLLLAARDGVEERMHDRGVAQVFGKSAVAEAQ